jgi:hypothetical protein
MASKVDTTKINKKKRLAEIDAELEKCTTYLKYDPDPMAENRVKALDKNPCVSGMYYLNAVYKNIQSEMSEELAKDPYYHIPISGTVPYGDEGYINCFIVQNRSGFGQKIKYLCIILFLN